MNSVNTVKRILLILAILVPFPLGATELQRMTTEGPVLGFANKEDTLSWYGIPYAKAPVGERRWRAPEAPEKRERLLQAKDNSAICPQLSGPMYSLNVFQWNLVVGNEDCLYLNITAPAKIGENEKLPVMVWIHGGGNSIGSKGNRAYTGEVLSAYGRVVLVSVNYRLGPLGWFYHPAFETQANAQDQSGNYGTLDLIQALTWIQANIENFGGDAGRVTIFGESAGAANTYSLLLSPLAKDLFHGAVMQSGGIRLASKHFASASVEQQGHKASSNEILASLLVKQGRAGNREQALEKIAAMPARELMALLRNTSPEELITAYSPRAAGMLDWPGMIGDGHVLPNRHSDTLFTDTALFNALPVIVGSNHDENKTFMALDPAYVAFPFRIRDKENYHRSAAYLSQNWKRYGVDEHARAMAEHHEHVYAYRFDWDDLPDLMLVDLSELIGAGHGLEIPFVFGAFKSDFYIDLLFSRKNREQRKALSQNMMNYWVNFAYTGSPNQGPRQTPAPWSPWNKADGGEKFIILDSDNNDDAYTMSGDDVHETELKQALIQDTHIDEQTRCRLFARMFLSADLALNKEADIAYVKQHCPALAFP